MSPLSDFYPKKKGLLYLAGFFFFFLIFAFIFFTNLKEKKKKRKKREEVHILLGKTNICFCFCDFDAKIRTHLQYIKKRNYQEIWPSQTWASKLSI